MSLPVYKIETYTGGVKDYTIEDEALNIFCKEIITDGIGHFHFTVPTVKGVPNPYYYNDIAVNDTVKIYFGYGSVGANPNFIGKVGMISAPLSTEMGYIRVISGLSQGEILLRRFKKNKFYDAVAASTIVNEWAADLGLGAGDIQADASQVTLEVRTKSYFDLMQFISDYWVNAGSQIKKDFWVDLDGDLYWHTRPFRSGASVETFTVGDNILSYNVTRKIDGTVFNDITVYGCSEAAYPRDKDGWTETTDDWTASVGSVDRSNAPTVKVGSWKIMGSSGAGGSQVTFKRDIPRVHIRDINVLYFWHWAASVPPHSGEVRLHAPDNTNYFSAELTVDGSWHWNELPLGPQQEYDAATNPNGTWSKTGSPNWWDIEYIEFDFQWSANDQHAYIDGMYFHGDRWSHNVTDGATPKREHEVTDDKLHSDADCQKRGETLLYQLKDSPVQIDLAVPGNTNVLVGDRLSMTIPAEDISAANYDVMSVTQSFDMNGFRTFATMMNSANIRQPIETDNVRKLIRLNRAIRELRIERSVK